MTQRSDFTGLQVAWLLGEGGLDLHGPGPGRPVSFHVTNQTKLSRSVYMLVMKNINGYRSFAILLRIENIVATTRSNTVSCRKIL